MRLVEMNYDVLSLMLHQLSPRDYKAVSETSWSCRSLAVPFLLKQVTVDTYSNTHAASFFEFVLADPIPRGVHLRHLSVRAYSYDPPVLRKVAQLLSHTPNLISLWLHLHLREPKDWIDLPPAVRALPQLSSVQLTGCARHPHDLLVGMTGSLTYLKIDGGINVETLRLLLPLQSSLQTLVLRYRPNDPSEACLSVAALGAMQWPALQHLVLERPDEVAHPDVLAMAFPNIRSLDVGLIRRARSPVIRDLATWTSLERVCGSWESFSALAIPCPIRHLEVILTRHQGERDLLDFLGGCVPVVLFLRMVAPRPYPLFEALSPAMGRMKYLDVHLDYNEMSEAVVTDARLLAAAAATNEISYLGLTVNCHQGSDLGMSDHGRIEEEFLRPLLASGAVRYAEFVYLRSSFWEFRRGADGVTSNGVQLDGERIREKLLAEL